MGRFEVGLAVCDRDGSGCEALSSATAEFGQETFGADFGRVRATLAPIDAVIEAGRSLVLTIAVPNESDRDLWFAYGTTTHPAELRLG